LKTNTRIDAIVPWRTDFYKNQPLFQPVEDVANYYSQFQQWPGLADYRRQLSQRPPIESLNGKVLSIVEQAGKPADFSEQYASRIYYNGEIQTRANNWHDFFQLLTWFIFPKTKAMINSIHIPLARERINQEQNIGKRSSRENMLSLFDEGGVVIISSNELLLNHIRNFEWKRLFWECRDELNRNLRCITFGHAMYEKGLQPYIGMTANAILLHTSQTVIKQTQAQQIAWIDQKLAELFKEGVRYIKPKDLSPFPILGMPGWIADNEFEAFYDNKQYFRDGRKKQGGEQAKAVDLPDN